MRHPGEVGREAHWLDEVGLVVQAGRRTEPSSICRLQATAGTAVRTQGGVGSLREQGALVSWLYRMATNVFLDRVRAEGSRRLADADEQDGQGSGLIKELPDSGPPVDLEGDLVLGGVRLCAGVAAAGHHQPDRHRHRHRLGARPAAVATLLAVLVAAGHVLLGRPRTQFAETAGLLVVGVGGALLYGLLPSSPAFLLA